MAGHDLKIELVKKLSKVNIILSADFDYNIISNIDLDVIVEKIIELKKDAPMLKIATNNDIKNIVDIIKKELMQKAPLPIEVNRSSTFKPIADEFEASYKIMNKGKDRTGGTVSDFVVYFNDRLNAIKDIFATHRKYSITHNLETLKNYTDGREVVIVGIVSNKITTKNGNIMVVIEDETDESKIMFMNNPNNELKKLFESASKIINDEVIAIRGKISGPFIIARELLWPDIPIKERKTITDDIAVALISDTHIGSKLFMEKNFSRMLEWLNGNIDTKSKELAGKIKYMIVGGDIVDGIGVYPGHDRDLAILDIYKQYEVFANFLSEIPEYIQVFVLPGNHDAVQKSEPQPELGSDLINVKLDNVHFVPNPNYISVHGLEILTYHGTSLDSIIRSIPNMSYAKPESAMIEILKRRHLSPIYGGNTIVPTRYDTLVIDNVPDILHMGHIHKNGIDEYHGVQIVNSGTFQDRTEYQIKQGHIPTPCNVPIFEMKKYGFTTIDFNSEF